MLLIPSKLSGKSSTTVYNRIKVEILACVFPLRRGPGPSLPLLWRMLISTPAISSAARQRPREQCSLAFRGKKNNLEYWLVMFTITGENTLCSKLYGELAL